MPLLWFLLSPLKEESLFYNQQQQQLGEECHNPSTLDLLWRLVDVSPDLCRKRRLRVIGLEMADTETTPCGAICIEANSSNRSLKTEAAQNNASGQSALASFWDCISCFNCLSGGSLNGQNFVNMQMGGLFPRAKHHLILMLSMLGMLFWGKNDDLGMHLLTSQPYLWMHPSGEIRIVALTMHHGNFVSSECIVSSSLTKFHQNPGSTWLRKWMPASLMPRTAQHLCW